MTLKTIFVVAALFLTGCAGATAFTGDAQFPGGEKGCARKCVEHDMVMSGYVFMGAYSSACVCQAAGGKLVTALEAAATPGGAIGAVMQMRATEEEQAKR